MNNVDFDELLKQGVLCGKKMVPVYCTTDLSIFKENDLNRSINPTRVNEFVYKLKLGRYMTGKPYIEVLPDLTLADGHHRIKAIKSFLAQEDCPVESVPVWFMVTENPEYLHNSNTGGSMWKTADHLKYYNKEGKIHYRYVEQALKEIKKQQKELHIVHKLGNSEILNILRGYSAGSNLQTDRLSHYEVGNGELKVMVKKEYILNILPYYKDIQTMPEYQNILKTTCTRSNFLTFLIVLYVFNCDINYVVTKIMNIKKISYVLSQAEHNGGIKEVLFNELGIRFKRKLFKDIGDLLDCDFSNLPETEMTFYSARCFYNRLVKVGFFRPEGVWKQEELMNQNQNQ